MSFVLNSNVTSVWGKLWAQVAEAWHLITLDNLWHLGARVEVGVENIQCLVMGLVLGLVLIGLLAAFPGIPFDYDADLVALQREENHRLQEVCEDTVTTTSEMKVKDDTTRLVETSRRLEIEKAASRVRVDQLTTLLGLEETAVKQLVEKAKLDTLAGKSPEKGKNYMQLADRLFYLIGFSLLFYFAWKDYGLGLILERTFPKEFATFKALHQGARQVL